MNGDYNSYGNVNSPEDTTSVWVDNNTPNVSMEPLVDQFGNLRFGNQVIPLTTPIAPYLSQTPNLPNLGAPPYPNLNTAQLPLNSPLLTPQLTSQPTGQYYVVTMQQAPSNISSVPLNSVPTQTYVHPVISQKPDKIPSPGEGFNANPLRIVSTQAQSPSDNHGVNPLRTVQTSTQINNPSDIYGVNSLRHVPNQAQGPTDNHGVNPLQNVQTSTQINNPSDIYGVNSLRHVQTHQNYNEHGSNGVNRPTQLTNGAHARQTNVGSPETEQAVYQRLRKQSDQESLFPGQPYMRKISIDHSNGEVIRSPERDVPPLVSSTTFTTQLPVEDTYANDRSTGSSSMTSSASVSPYNSVPSSPRADPGASLIGPGADNKTVYDPVPPRYTKPTAKSRCLVCDKTVYAMEKRGPIKTDVLFHKACFRCAVCAMMLDLKNFCHNPNDLADLNIYCKSHKPSEKFGKLDAGALSITRALQAPRLGQLNEQIRGGPEAMKGGKMDAGALNIRSALNVPKAQVSSNETVKNTAHSYQIDNQTVAMVHARSVPATELQVANKLRAQVWSRDKRRAEGVPPPDVIRYDTRLSDYGEDPYSHDPPS